MLREGLAIPGPMRNENTKEMNFPIQWIKLSITLFNALFLFGVIGIGNCLRMKESTGEESNVGTSQSCPNKACLNFHMLVVDQVNISLSSNVNTQIPAS
jgi:hypothetical protein